MRRAPLASLLVLAACPDPEPGPPAPPVQLLESQATSGTRLRPRFVVGDGLRLFRGWEDAQRGEMCRFAVAADGELRCLPGVPGLSAFADDRCSTPAIVVSYDDACAPPTHAWVRTACDPRTHLHAVGAALASAFFKAPDGSCLAGSLPLGSVALSAGAEVDPAAFVSARREEGPASRGLAVTRLVAADGAAGERQLRDPAGSLDCWASAVLGDVRCLPMAPLVAGPPVFGDDACTQPAAYLGCHDASHVLLRRADAVELWSLGAPSPAFELAAGSCSAFDPDPRSARLLGARRAASEFVAGSHLAAGNRLKLDAARFDAIAPLITSQGLPSDVELQDATCLPQAASDGTLRCLPAPISSPFLPVFFPPAFSGFADDSCTVPLGLAAWGFASRVDGTPTCPRRLRIHRAGAAHSGPTYHRGESGACAASSAFSGYALVRLGDELPASSFVPMQLE